MVIVRLWPAQDGPPDPPPRRRLTSRFIAVLIPIVVRTAAVMQSWPSISRRPCMSGTKTRCDVGRPFTPHFPQIGAAGSGRRCCWPVGASAARSVLWPVNAANLQPGRFGRASATGGDRRQLVLPVATTILAGRDGQSSRPPASSCAGHRLCRYTVRVNSIDTHHGSPKGHYVNPTFR